MRRKIAISCFARPIRRFILLLGFRRKVLRHRNVAEYRSNGLSVELKRTSNILAKALLLVLLLSGSMDAEEMKLWLYLPTNLLVAENIDKNIRLLDRAAKAGYNGILLADSKFCRFDKLPDRYAENVKRFRDEIRKRNIRCFAAVCPIGYSNDMLSRDPNLAEGLPVVDAPFIVKDGFLVPETPGKPILENGGFENYRNNKWIGWGFVDEPGKIGFRDESDMVEGKASLRMRNPNPSGPCNARAMQKLDVEPFRHYHVSVMLKTEDFDATGAINITVLGKDGQSLNWHMPTIQKNQDWRRIDITFNSLDNESVNLYFGVWGIRNGSIRWDDARVEPAGFVNVLRRNGTPISLRDESNKIVFEEGKDFETIKDPLLGNDPSSGSFSAWHEMPVVKIPAGSRLKEGDRVRADYYHTSVIYGEQVGCCMAEPETREFLRWQIEQVHKLVAPDGYFMSHDEIRQGGWDKSCVDTGKSPAEILSDNVSYCVETIRKEDPGKPIGVWSDMFDPTHNACEKKPYYLVKGNGPWFGSWNKLPRDVMIMNWNSDPKIRGESFNHFAEHGSGDQMLAGYYDDPRVEEKITGWMRDVSPLKGFRGVMYTTWRNDYDHLERFAEAARKEWDSIQKTDPHDEMKGKPFLGR